MSRPYERASQDADLFAVVGHVRGWRLQITARSAQAAAAAADYWCTHYPGAATEWFLRDDVTHERPVLVLTRRRWEPPATDGSLPVHAIALIPGKPVSTHPAAYCDTTAPLASMQICYPDMGMPCMECLLLASLDFSDAAATTMTTPRAALCRNSCWR